MKAEDEQDVKAASLLKAEQDAELAEFNESIPLDDEISVSNVPADNLTLTCVHAACVISARIS